MEPEASRMKSRLLSAARAAGAAASRGQSRLRARQAAASRFMRKTFLAGIGVDVKVNLSVKANRRQ
jgi:Flp pilus assembly protein TadG